MEEAAIREPRVALRYFDGCPNWRTAYQRLNEVLAETGYEEITVALELVETPEEAERLREHIVPSRRMVGDPAKRRAEGVPDEGAVRGSPGRLP